MRRETTVGAKRQLIHASAPARLDFAGGWTDVAPFAVEERGVVVNAAIELRAHAEVRFGGERYLLRSDDLDRTLELESLAAVDQDAKSGRTGEGLDLLRAALRRSRPGPCQLRTWSEAPPGAGLGSSGALGVALVAALDASGGIDRGPEELAEEAWRLETVEAALPGGKQDQFAAALGGFHRLGFESGAVHVDPLLLDPAFTAALAEHTVVCYTGTSRVSSRTIARVMDAYAGGEAQVVGALRAMVEVAERMAEAVRAGDLARTAKLLSENWRYQQQLDRGMATETMVRLEAAMRDAGALGGKAAGAGAGGSMFFVVKNDPLNAAAVAREAGARVLQWRWAPAGVEVG